MFALLHYFDIDALEAAVAATIGIATAPAVVLLVAAELKAEGPVTRRALWHVALNNIIAMLGVALLLPFIEARAGASRGIPIARALWLVAGSFLLGYVAFRVARAARALRRQGRRAAVHPGRRDDRADRRRRADWPGCRCCSRCSCSASARATSIRSGG